MTALMPSETACLANEDDGQAVRDSSVVQTVWTSPEEIVAFFLYLANLVASEATRSNISLTTEFINYVPRLGSNTSVGVDLSEDLVDIDLERLLG